MIVATARQEAANTPGIVDTANSVNTIGGSNTIGSLSKSEKRRLRGIEHRSLPDVMSEGIERVANLSACVANATRLGLFGKETRVTYCRATKGKKQCQGKPPCEICNTHTEPWCNPREYLEEVMFMAHVGKSAYAMQLRRWFDVFGQENFKVVFTDDMAEDPLGTLGGVLDFIGLDMLDPRGEKGLRTREAWAAIVGARYNTADKVKKETLDSQATPELRQLMKKYFARHNKDLQELLGVPLPSSWHVED